VTTILAPEQPRGCPNETAPPLTLTLSFDKPNIFALAKPTTEKASLNSKNQHLIQTNQLYLVLLVMLLQVQL